MRQVGPAPGDDVVGRYESGLGLECDKGTRALAPDQIRLSDDRRFHDLRVAVEDLLDLEGGDVLATRNDDVLRAVLDLDVAVGMPDCEVAGVKPALREGCFGRRRVFQ